MRNTETPAAETKSTNWHPVLRWEWVLLAVVAAAILITRFPGLNQRLLEAHSFRQTSTAIQTVGFYQSGIDLLRPMVPVLGAPWSIPFEFPLFQALASVPMSWGIGADAANRLTGLGFFIITAGALWTLIRLVADRYVAAIALIVFSFSPFAMLWSRASLIEYMATAAALGWVISAIRWRQTSDWKWAVLGTLLGVIAATVKITTAIPWVAPILLFRPLSDAASKLDWKRWFQKRLQPAYLTMLAVPALAGLSWTLHADAVKGASPSTAWLTSGALRTWNFGTVEQRLSGRNIDTILERIDGFVLGRGWLLLAIIAAVMVKRHRAFWVGMLLVPLLAIGGFFNLYLVHDYYLAAITPALAALLALGIRQAVVWMRIRRHRLVAGLATITIAWVGLNLVLAYDYWSPVYREFGRPDASREITALTEPDEYSMVRIDSRFSWSPHVLYYAERRGMMLREPPLTISIMASQPDLSRYRLLWTDDPRGPSVEYASVRQWFAPVSDRSLVLGTDAAELGPVGVLASVAEVLPEDAGLQPLALIATSIDCNGTDKLEIPAGPGAAWLTIRTEGEARAQLREGLITIPSATRTVVWRPNNGFRQQEQIVCFGNGRLSIDSAVAVTTGT